MGEQAEKFFVGSGWSIRLDARCPQVPMQCFYASLTGVIVYFLVGLNTHGVKNFFMFELCLMAMANCGSAVGFVLSCKAADIGQALALAPIAVLPQAQLAGFLIDVPSMFFPFRILSYAVFYRYAWQALMFNEFDCPAFPLECVSTTPSGVQAWTQQGTRSRKDSPCPFGCDSEELAPGGVCQITTCSAALQSLGLADRNKVWPMGDDAAETVLLNILMLIGLAVVIRFVGFVALFKTYQKIEAKGRPAE